MQPIIGYLSDRTWSPRWGRRRPYFTVGAVLASLALLVMPNVTALWAWRWACSGCSTRASTSAWSRLGPW
ncbi:MAG: hypothetical protein WKG07_12150 [Hymenobacter sp.]